MSPTPVSPFSFLQSFPSSANSQHFNHKAIPPHHTFSRSSQSSVQHSCQIASSSAVPLSLSGPSSQPLVLSSSALPKTLVHATLVSSWPSQSSLACRLCSAGSPISTPQRVSALVVILFLQLLVNVAPFWAQTSSPLRRGLIIGRVHGYHVACV